MEHVDTVVYSAFRTGRINWRYPSVSFYVETSNIRRVLTPAKAVAAAAVKTRGQRVNYGRRPTATLIAPEQGSNYSIDAN